MNINAFWAGVCMTCLIFNVITGVLTDNLFPWLAGVISAFGLWVNVLAARRQP